MGKCLNEERTINLKLKFVITFAKRSEKEIKAGYDQLETGKQTIKINSPAGRYFHVQYQPLPKSEPIKIDIITFGIGAKIYFYEGGSCVGEESVEILHDNFVSFICVEKSHEFTFKSKHLAELYKHKIGITLADNKLLVSSRARHESAKSFKSKIFINDWATINEAQQKWFPSNEMVSQNLENIHRRAQEYNATRVPSRTKTTSNHPAANKMSKAEKLVASLAKSLVETEKETPFSMTPTSKGPKANSAIDIDFGLFFTNKVKTYERANYTTESVFDFYAIAELNTPLLSDEKLSEFNPMLVSIRDLGPLPQKPSSIEKLKQLCHPVLIEFDLFGERFCTRTLPHEEMLRMQSDFVILLGTKSLDLVFQEFQHSPLKLRILDREVIDRTDGPALFGDDPTDPYLSSTDHLKLIQARRNMMNSHGLATLKIDQFTDGTTTFINRAVPVLPVEGSSGFGEAAGHYLSSRTEIQIKIKIHRPIKPVDLDFFTMIMVVPGAYSEDLENFKSVILRNNQDVNFHVENKNIITGFHIQTRDQQFLSIESSRENISELWNSDIVQILGSYSFIFFDSSVSMSERKYKTLDTRFSRILLDFSLSDTLKKSILYCKSSMPSEITSAFIKLSSYKNSLDLKSLISGDGLLTETEVRSLINDLDSLFDSYGVYDTFNDLYKQSKTSMGATI